METDEERRNRFISDFDFQYPGFYEIIEHLNRAAVARRPDSSVEMNWYHNIRNARRTRARRKYNRKPRRPAASNRDRNQVS
jgi:hypothetical protein